MTSPAGRSPFDPDPRTPDEWDDLWDPIDRVWVPRPSPLPVLFIGLVWGLIVGLLTGIFLATHVLAAPLPAPQPTIPVASVEGRTEAPWTTSAGSRTSAPHPSPTPTARAVPRPSGPVSRGVASWYCGHGSRCTVGHPAGYFAAIRSDLLGHRGDRARVCSASRCVVVRVIDCNCARGANLVDLYADAFDDLAPLSRGRIAVTLEWLP